MIKNLFKGNSYLLLLVLLLVGVASCTSYKKVPYLQNSQDYAKMEQKAVAFEPKIQPQDLLSIVVLNPDDPSASISYNLITPSDQASRGYISSQPTLQEYLVDADGNVTIPNVGKVRLSGLTTTEAESLILDKVKGAFAATPVVTVRFADFRVSVLGEVTSPGSYTVKNGKVNVFQALALARDLTIYGMRENVKLIRENIDGKKEIIELDLNDASLLNSPYYYLCQNDILYVTPNKSKAKNSDVGTSTSLWFSATSILVSIVSLLYNILKN